MQREAIAIVGMACRVPGASSAAELWRLLREARCEVRPVPADRWPDDGALPDPARWGAFLEGSEHFDPEPFRLSSQEAAQMDPQQRLALELAWEAFEDAGAATTELARARCGVYVGTMSTDFDLERDLSDDRIDVYAATGSAHCIVANRISYTFDLGGPSVAIETACSSSLVAVHTACQSLWLHESDLALAGGVQLMLSPWSSRCLARSGLTSPDGRCRAFDADANGFVRGEGGALVLLKRLADAQRDGDRIRAVLLGSAINQDGRSNGLMAPSERAQRELLRSAYACAGVDPARVSYVEAHGSGTSVGDAIEVQALGAVVGIRRGTSCKIGSIKTNIGHLEAAAGIAGLVKVALALERGAIPPSLHFRANARLALDRRGLEVAAETGPWPAAEGAPIAGVSSFGFGGTNAHAVLCAAPPTDVPASRALEAGWFVLPLSAHSPAALARRAAQLAEHLAGASSSDADAVCATFARRRAALSCRRVLVARSPEELRAELERLAESGEEIAPLRSRKPRVVFVFPDAPQGTARELEELVARAPAPRAARAAGEELRATPLAVQRTLGALWVHHGVSPDAVLGVGSGEIAAAHGAGALSLRDALLLFGWRAGSEVPLVAPYAPKVPLWSALRGRAVDTAELDAAHWAGIAADVRIDRVIEELCRDGADVFVEIGLQGSLGPAIRAAAERIGEPVAVVSLSGSDASLEQRWLEGLGRAWSAGLALDWSALYAWGPPAADLPAYPWLRREIRFPRAARHGAARGSLRLADGEELREHRVEGRAILPGAAFVAAAFEIARGAGVREPCIEAIELERPLPLDGHGPVELGYAVQPTARGCAIELGVEGARSAHARIGEAGSQALRGASLQALRARCARAVDPEDFTAQRVRAGVCFAPAQLLPREIATGPGAAVARLAVRPDPRDSLDGIALDAAFQLLDLACAGGPRSGRPLVPVRLTGIRHVRRAAQPRWAGAELVQRSPDGAQVSGRIWLWTEAGELVLSVEELTALAPAEAAAQPGPGPGSELEREIAAQVAELFDLPREAVPPERSLHELGGDSLTVVALRRSLEVRFDARLTLPALLGCVDARAIARLIEQQGAAASPGGVP